VSYQEVSYNPTTELNNLVSRIGLRGKYPEGHKLTYIITEELDRTKLIKDDRFSFP